MLYNKGEMETSLVKKGGSQVKKKIFALLTALCMTAAVLPAVFADGEGEATIGMSEQEQCSCIVLCTEDNTGAVLLYCPLYRGQQKP